MSALYKDWPDLRWVGYAAPDDRKIVEGFGRLIPHSRSCRYAHLVQTKRGNQNHATAASYRNSSFLVVPKRATAPMGMYKRPKNILSEDPKEMRTFEYFVCRALPMWTEFFESELGMRTPVPHVDRLSKWLLPSHRVSGILHVSSISTVCFADPLQYVSLHAKLSIYPGLY